MSVRPDKLYKYERIDAQSLRNLKAQSIYFGSPRGFNDPYDCALTPNIKIPTHDEVEIVRAEYLRDHRLTPKQRDEIQNASPSELGAVLRRAADKAFRDQTEKFLTERGVACFSEIPDDLLMWAHYGGKYKGMCLEFDTSFEPLTKARKVTYTRALPELNAAKTLKLDDVDEVMRLYCTKSDSWSYEREWRAFHNQAGTLFGYQTEALTGIYFGPDIEPEMLEIVCLVLAGQNEKVTLYEGQRSTTEFNVTFKSFQYTSYIDAKRRGLRD